MAAEPGASGRRHLRASHADRERVIGTLKAAFVQGRLTKDELDARAGETFAARTYGELAALTADLPAGLADAASPRRAARAGWPMSNAAKAALWVIVAVTVPVVLSFFTGSAALFLLFTPFYFTALAFLGAETLVSCHEKPSHRRQLPPGPGPGPGGTTSQRLPPAGPAGQLPSAGHGPWHITEAARSRLPRPPLPVRGHRAGGALAAGTAPASG
jgi:hypothetical protein